MSEVGRGDERGATSEERTPTSLRAPRSPLAYDVDALRREEFPWAADAIYLNHASTGPLPARTVAAVEAWTRRRSQPHLIGDAEQFETMRTARRLAAALVGADPAEIALMPNTSYGLNLAAGALPLEAGDVVVTFDGEFPANVYPWMALGDRGVRLELVPCVDGVPDEEALVRALARDDVRALTVSWVQFATGWRTDLARLGALCRDAGKWFVVDAIQGLGPLTLDARACRIDVLACGMQKWLLSPWGTGFVYVRRELVERLRPTSVGWMAVRGPDDFSRLTDYDFTLREDARRFEVMTLAYQDFAGANASLALLHELGLDAVAAHVHALADRIVAWALSRDDVRLVTPADPARRAGIVSLTPRDPAAASARLRAAGVAHSLREGAIRLSPHAYNTVEEVERALGVLGGASSVER